MPTAKQVPIPFRAAMLLMPLLVSLGPSSARSQITTGTTCVLQAVDLKDTEDGVRLDLRTDGNPISLRTQSDPSGGLMLDLTGCVPGPALSGRAFATGLVSALELIQRAGEAGPITAVVVRTRGLFEASINSGDASIQVLLSAKPERAAERSEPAPVSPIQVMEPLPLPPEATSGRDEIELPDSLETLRSSVKGWAQTWSEQREEDYLSFYAGAFQPPAGLGRTAWETRRRQQIREPARVEVTLDSVHVELTEASLGVVSFRQVYRSGNFSEAVFKTQTWIEEDGTWRILDEQIEGRKDTTAISPADSRPSLPAPIDTLHELVSRLLAGARLSVTRAPQYDSAYQLLSYPGGDPGWNRSTGVDVIVRAFRHLDADLQKLIHEEILAAPEPYGVSEPDPNIDHRRIRNLAVFLNRRSQTLGTSAEADWQPGDLVLWARGGKAPNHVGIVSDLKSTTGRPLVIHHLENQLPREEDVLDAWPIFAHHRWLPRTETNN